MNRRSYSGLMSKPAWGLYTNTTAGNTPDELVATVRADSAHEARRIFKEHWLRGERVRRIP